MTRAVSSVLSPYRPNCSSAVGDHRYSGRLGWTDHAVHRINRTETQWLSFFESRRFVGTTRRISRTVRMRSSACQLAFVDNQILLTNWPALKPALQNFSGTRGVPSLGRQCGTRNVRRHPRGAPAPAGMILGRRIKKPNLPRVPGKLAVLEGPHDRIPVANL